MKIFYRNFNSLNHSKIKLKWKYISEHFNVDQVDKDVLIIRSKIQGINKNVINMLMMY